ncbi:hypothetical protein MGG_03633 [Pyricularia oryzae 70-15]|uniref:Meiotically up-regulated protein Msb1/Mug8 domain-containing protein n=1 Tax=Pyricularia oryzae (strain 70-15 / ATCC MYA-4617 / FGSC 8958) TaxID=242507 RepID=G4N725_PYRO7|nr:uncharacterized protein MGG_03633 [Pyricularia oryzae 70-15]EHA49938.1 hypothetical protein MGG_03633 [Pyricularia oryzae 70-15]KAI7911116.1 hypothetical protein M9X92_010700 [Pyricularia oryzae]KAI7927194.1 hypothetical protein M0657_003290 [Pyricularia oryzae]
MPSIFSRLKGKDGPTKISKSKKNGNLDHLTNQLPQKPQWEDGFARTTVEPEEVQELVHRCTSELKARGLDIPFLLLPFRPTSNPSAVRTFIRHFFDHSSNLRGDVLGQELRMLEPMVISGVIKWCWARLQGGVVGWDAYELFKVGEHDSDMARDSFRTFIPLSVENEARTSIIFDFFDLLAAVAAHGKMNGFGGRKLSRMASWWAFEHKDTSNGFEGGYKLWLRAADATSHLFFAYLRSVAPQQTQAGISMLPMSLQKLLQETEYPPERPSLMMSTTYKVVMIVETVSPTPFALLRRGNHFQYRDSDRPLFEFSDYEDPVQALTEECRRVLKAIAAANQTQAVSSAKHSTGLRDASWSRFEDIGFGATLMEEDDDSEQKQGRRQITGLRTTPASGVNLARPTTPSWADFLSSGFAQDGPNSPSNLLLPPDKVLPPIDTTVRQRSAQSHRPRLESEQNLEPGELASISRLELDDSFWWVWMTSLAPEETAERKSSFGRCAVIETQIRSGRWLIFEEMVKGAAPEPDEGAYIAEKKSFFSWTRRNKTGMSRSKSVGKNMLGRGDGHGSDMSNSKTSIGPDQQARIQAAAQRLHEREMMEKQAAAQNSPTRRGRTDAELIAEKTKSIMTIQSGLKTEASPAMQWANRYDKEAIREAYLSSSSTGRGLGQSTMQTNGNGSYTPIQEDDEAPPPPQKSPSLFPPASPAVAPQSPVTRQPLSQGPTPEPAALPPPPQGQHSMDLQRSNLVSPEPDFSPDNKKQQKKLHKEKEKEKGSGGFRKLFGRKKDKEPKQQQGSEFTSNGFPPVAAAGVAGGTVAAAALSPEPHMAGASSLAAPSERTEDLTPRAHTPVTPTIPAAGGPPPVTEYEPSIETVSPIETVDANEAHEEFSRFDQGPLADQPAFIPDDSDSDASFDAIPPPIARQRENPAAQAPPSPAPVQAPAPEVQSPSTLTPAQDRWAQIRKNAADRAAQQRQSEDQSQGGYSKTTDGDGDTSGEETIESRVARIKARVAELTGNMEGSAPPGSRTPPPIRR